jgi:hypothetical protein
MHPFLLSKSDARVTWHVHMSYCLEWMDTRCVLFLSTSKVHKYGGVITNLIIWVISSRQNVCLGFALNYLPCWYLYALFAYAVCMDMSIFTEIWWTWQVFGSEFFWNPKWSLICLSQLLLLFDCYLLHSFNHICFHDSQRNSDSQNN